VEAVASNWNASFHGFSADDRARILALASPSGIVYAQQLPDANAAKKQDDRVRSAFAPYLNGQIGNLKPTETTPLNYFDAELDRWQKEAVAKALAARDLFLLRGHPGSGKSRVLVEIVRQASARGERVLFLSRTPKAIDRVLNSLAEQDGFAVRCLQPGENENLLRPQIRTALVESRVAELTRRAREAGIEDRAACQRACQNYAQAIARYPDLAELLNTKAELQKEKEALESRQLAMKRELANLEDADHDAGATAELRALLSAWHAEANQRKATALDEVGKLHQAVSECSATLAQLQAEDAKLQPIQQARKGGRFWTPTWWATLLKSTELRRADEVAQLLRTANSQLEASQKALADGIAQQKRLDEEAALARKQLLLDEVSRRETVFGHERMALDAQLAELTARWQNLCNLFPVLTNITLTDQHDLEQARATWVHEQEQARIGTIRAEQWLALVEKQPNALRKALLENVPLLAATAAGWNAARASIEKLTTRPFDTLILEEAEAFTESECTAYACLAGRWLFVGSDYLLDSDLSEANRQVPQKRDSNHLQPPAFFGQLWGSLHSNPERLPYSWVEEGDKLICRLRPILPEQRAWIETEHLADHPQIVLHILALPRSRPVVAEVLFPASFTIQNAKQFILRELEELAVCSTGRSMRWQDDHAERLVLQLATHACQHPAQVALAPGIREMLNPQEAGGGGSLASVAWQTCCIEFDRESGWQRGTAEAWVERHLGLRDLGRTLFLDSLHRFKPGMAAFVKSLLSSHPSREAAVSETGAARERPAIDFVAVPAMPDSVRAERAGVSRARPAGLELDLSEPRNRERLPPELRSGLSSQGFVNLAEAEAIINRLAELDRAGLLSLTSAVELPVFVVVLHESQVALIRRLLRATPVLAARSQSIEVDVPRAFAHREARRVLLGLTRSHAHRVTAFGDSPKDLLLALSRAREQLIVFGDIGSLARRANWEGTVDRLDPQQADQERNLIRALLAGFQEFGSRSSTAGSEGFAT
jgi:hypothetical protein